MGCIFIVGRAMFDQFPLSAHFSAICGCVHACVLACMCLCNVRRHMAYDTICCTVIVVSVMVRCGLGHGSLWPRSWFVVVSVMVRCGLGHGSLWSRCRDGGHNICRRGSAGPGQDRVHKCPQLPQESRTLCHFHQGIPVKHNFLVRNRNYIE